MYTEKISLRITPEDKDKFQIEADKQKLPLTTYLRNKISGIEDENKEFEPQLISYDSQEHNKKQHSANLQLKKFEQIKVEASKYIDLPTTKEGLTEFLTNPLNYLTSQIEIKHRPSINIPISKEKLLDLLDINLSSLNAILNGYDSRLLTVDDNNTIKTKDFRKQFETYTSNEAENKRLIEGNDMINSFVNVGGKGYNNANIHQLANILKDLVIYDSSISNLRISPRYVKG